MGDNALRTIITEGEECPALGHHWGRSPADIRKGETRDIHCTQEVLTRCIGISALQLGLVGKSDRMDDKVQAAPCFAKIFKEGIH